MAWDTDIAKMEEEDEDHAWLGCDQHMQYHAIPRPLLVFTQNNFNSQKKILNWTKKLFSVQEKMFVGVKSLNILNIKNSI